MPNRRFLVVLALALVPASARAQALAQPCRSGSLQLEDACQKATDVFSFLLPQLGVALAGGSVAPGADAGSQEHTLSVALRVNATQGALPDLGALTANAGRAQRDNLATTPLVIGAPATDMSLRVVDHLPFLGSASGALDVLASLAYVPSVQTPEIGVASGGFKVGYGARATLVTDEGWRPSIAVSWLERGLPAMDVTYSGAGSDDTLTLGALTMRTTALRAVMSKRLGFLGLSAGGGVDDYRLQGQLRVVVNDGGRRYSSDQGDGGYLFAFAPRMTRTNLFAGASLQLSRIRLVGEVGRTSGGHLQTFNSFSGATPNDPRTYASMGFRIE